MIDTLSLSYEHYTSFNCTQFVLCSRMSLRVLSIVLAALQVSVLASNVRSVPPLSQDFSLASIEVDDNVGRVVLSQRVWWNLSGHRLHMLAIGPLVNGRLEQYTLGAPGTNAADVLSNFNGSCTNISVASMQWLPFWSFPSNASYVGRRSIPTNSQPDSAQSIRTATATLPLVGDDATQSVSRLLSSRTVSSAVVHAGAIPPPPPLGEFDCWTYWLLHERFELYLNGTSPLWFGKVEAAAHTRWHFQYTEFVPHAPSRRDLTPPPGWCRA
eukprot:TRINITY_DN46594_c0_g1_i1.p1 TRINITY_DN46594_c0_g1~~TRINITY_DN46594_c0_g1_i1.p1  ORF type:complete len:270 (+),score=17.78 TRINITY_DN46594_c0_g1_i1:920-1729(+)